MPEEKNLTHRTLDALFWMLSGAAMRAALRVVSVVVLARLLTPEDFGIMSAAVIVVGLSALLSQLGIGPALIQRPDLDERHIRTGFTVAFAMSVLLGSSVVLAAPALSRVFNIAELTTVLRVTALLFPLSGVAVVADALMRREMRFRTFSLIQATTFAIGYVGFGIVFAAAGLGVWALVFAHIIQRGAMTLALLILHPHPKAPQFDRAAFRDLMVFGGGFTIARLLNYVALQADYFVTGRYLGKDALGEYSRAYQLLVFPVSLFGGVLDKVLFPSMALIQTETARLRKAFRQAEAAIALLFLPLSAIAVVLAPEIVSVALGPRWDAVVDPFRILAMGMFFRAAYKISDSVARATGAVFRRAWRQGVYALATVIGSLVGQEAAGLPGVAAGVLIALTVNYLLMTQLSLKLTEERLGSFVKLHAGGAFIGLVALGEAAAVAGFARRLGIPAIITLFATSGIVVVTVGGLFRFWPRSIGEGGEWVAEVLRRLLARLQRGDGSPTEHEADKELAVTAPAPTSPGEPTDDPGRGEV